MPTIYHARDMTDAALVRELLEDHGIDAQVRGAVLQGATGELPAAGGLVSVWVAQEQQAEAVELLARWERGEFALPDEPEAPPTHASPDSTPRRRRMGLLAFGLGAALGGGVLWLATHGPTVEDAVDHDGDGRIDERFVGSTRGVERIETDRNRDGKVDEILHFRGGFASSAESDNDFDGTMETRASYSGNLWRQTESDWDSDGIVDYRAEADAGVLSREQWMDPAGNPVKQVLYERGRPVAVEFDARGDGTFERRLALDGRAEPVDR